MISSPMFGELLIILTMTTTQPYTFSSRCLLHLEQLKQSILCSSLCYSAFSPSRVGPFSHSLHFQDNIFFSANEPVLIFKTWTRDLTTTKYVCELCCFLANYFLIKLSNKDFMVLIQKKGL